MDPNPNPRSKSNRRNTNRGTSSSQPNPNPGGFAQPNVFPSYQGGFSEFSNQSDFQPFTNTPVGQFSNQVGFSQFQHHHQPGSSSFPIQTNYNEFHLNPSASPRRFLPEDDDEEDEDFVPETDEDVAAADDDDDDDDEVEEVPVIPVTKQKGRAKSKKWSTDEEVALAKAYVGSSQNPVKGNQQKRDSFWNTVLIQMNEHLGEDSGRNNHQVRSKWIELNKKVTAWAGIYHKRDQKRASGTSDSDVLRKTHREYMKKMKVSTEFNHMAAWEVLRRFPKWSGVNTFEEIQSSSSKRARTSESNMRSSGGEFMPDLNDDECEQDEQEPEPETEPEPEEQPARQTQPPRRTGKKRATSSSSHEELVKMVSNFNTYSQGYIDRKMQAKEQKLRLLEAESQAKIAREQKMAAFVEAQTNQVTAAQKQADFQFYISPHDHLTGGALEQMLAIKREIAERWGFNF